MLLTVGILVTWVVASTLGTVTAAAMCRAGHIEDVGHGYAEDDLDRLFVPR